MAQLMTVRLTKGDSPSWGFRLQGGMDFASPLIVQKVNCGSPAERAGLKAGDSVIKINNTDVFNLRHKDAQDVIVRAGSSFEMTVQRGGSTWKPAVTPVGSLNRPQPSVNNVSPVTKTSLAAPRQDNIGAIGTGHNVSAKPFGGQVNGSVNGGPKFVNKQFNSPIGLYSEESIAETLSAQAEVLSPGVLGVNFKKNEKNYDASNSAVFRMVQEADKEPRDSESEQENSQSGVVTAPLGIAGLRHVTAPENKPTPPTPQLPPGQNICADCERLIVGVFVRIKDKNLHVECFKCATCGTSLKNVGYYTINNKLYCDIHAKLAARNNPPAPNLVPVTVPPGGKAPAGAISAALANHPLPSSGPLSPSSNNIAAPFQLYSNRDVSNVSNLPEKNLSNSYALNINSNAVIDVGNYLVNNNVTPLPYSKFAKKANLSGPRPFSSVSGPLSPSAQRSAPLSPKTYAPPPSFNSPAPPSTYSAPSSEHSFHNFIWPPPPEEPEIPTATPLYFPPPSQIQIHRKTTETIETESLPETCDYYIMEPTQKLCSSEVSDITCQKSSFECRETIRDTLGTQILVESVLQNRPKSPPPVEKFSDLTNKPTSICSDCTECKKIIKSDETRVQQTCAMSSESRISSNVLKDQKPQIDNVVPKDWESPMLSALKTVPDPPKRALGPLASALAVAPAEPFTPAPPISFEPVPLPEETEPYFPPEHPVVLVEEEPKKSREPKELPCDIPFAKTPERARTPANPPPKPPKKKKLPEDELLKELPKPQSRLTMREALTIAPERSYTPLSFSSCGSELEKELDNLSEAAGEPVKDKPKENVRPVINENVIKPFKPAFQPMKDNKIEIIPEPEELKIEKSLESPSCELKPNDTIQEDTKIVSSQTTTEIRSESVNSQDSFIKTAVAKQAEDTILRKPMPVHSLLHRPDNLPQYQVNLSENVEMEILMMEKQELVQKYAAKKQSELGNAKVVDNKPPEITNKGPVVIIQGQGPVDPNTSFQPVNDGTASRGPTSPCPRPLTPSMVNKPAPVIPYYQANLVAQQHLAPDVNVFDPKSTTSRSPSPSVEGRRSTTPFRSTPVERAKSPAPGPPPNPLKTNEPLPTPQDTLKEEAKKTVSSYIPQHLGKTEMCAAVSHKDFSGNYQEQFDSKQIVEKDKMIQEQSLNVMKQEEAASNKQKIVVEATDGNVATTKFSEESSSKHLKKLDKTQTKSVETSSDGMCRIERKKLVTEEFEQTQKETVTQVEKNVTTTKAIPNYPFRNVNNPVIEQQEHGEYTNKEINGDGWNEDVHFCNQIHITIPPSGTSSLCSKSPDTEENSLLCSPQLFDSEKFSLQAPDQFKRSQVTIELKLPDHLSLANHKRNEAAYPNNITNDVTKEDFKPVSDKRPRVCVVCNINITRGPFITALGKIWCPEHFICATPSCRRPLQDLGFVEERGQLYCEYCFEQYLAPACSKCSAKVKGDCLKAIGKNFHPECFNCSYCGKLFGNSPFFLEDGLPYCEADWNELFTTKCFACGFPVEAGDRWVEALNNNYHSQCFNCTMCKKNLEGQSFFAKGGRPFCKNHAR